MKILDISFLKTEPNRTDLKIKKKNRKLCFRGSVFKEPTLAVWGQFFTLSHSQFILQHDRINSQHIFLHGSAHCPSSSESLWLTISWTNSARKYVIFSVMHTEQHTVQKNEPKTETVVNLVKPKPNRKPQFFSKQNRKPNRSHFLLTTHPYPQGPSQTASVQNCSRKVPPYNMTILQRAHALKLRSIQC